MKRILLLISTALFLVMSCVREEIVLNHIDGSFDFTLNASMEDLQAEGAETKGTTTAVMRLLWEAGDEISVINLTTGKALGGSLVATKGGQKTSFTGSLSGSINEGDDLAFIYPSQDYTVEQPFTSATVDLSDQAGLSNVPYCVYANTRLSGGNVASTSADVEFKFLISFVQYNLSSLPKSQAVTELSVSDMGAELVLSIEDGKLKCESIPGTITISPASLNSNSDGNAALYFSTGAFMATPERRIVNIQVGGYDYKSTWTDRGYAENKYLTSIISKWTSSVSDLDIIFADKATVGKGIDVFFIGDGYTNSAEDISRYREDMLWMRNAFLSMEPFKSHEEYFNLYSTLAISSEQKQYEALTNGANDLGGNTKFHTIFHPNTTQITTEDNMESVIDFVAESIFVIEQQDATTERLLESLVVVMINADVNAGTCYMYYPASQSYDHGSGLGIGFFGRESNEYTRRTTLLHEAGGHGFAKLADEYSYSSNPFQAASTYDKDERYLLKTQFHAWGWERNVDAIQYPTQESGKKLVMAENTQPIWHEFINNSIVPYSGIIAAEQINTYVGAKTYPTDFWRPTPNSIMNNHYVETKFNAPSRRAIWYRIHKLADPSFVDDYAAFVAWDMAHQDQGINLISGNVAMYANYDAMKAHGHVPPVVKEFPGRKHKK